MDRFLIAPFDTGLETYLRPWLIPDQAFATLQNAYVWRGRVRKRFGAQLMGSAVFGSQTAPLLSRLRINIGTVAAHTIPGDASQLKIGQAFSVGSDIFTVYQLGAGVLTLSTNPAATATINSTTNPNTVVFTGEPAGSVVWYYPANPVMGLTIYEDYLNAFNNDPAYAFDTQFAYVFTAGSWQRSGTLLLHGTNLSLVWATNWRGATPDIKVLFITNFNFTLGVPSATDDPIWYTVDGATWTAAIGVNAFYFMPQYGGPPPVPQAPFTGAYIKTARIILPFQERLLLLNTVENDNPNHNGTAGTNTQYRNRVRYSHIGSPFSQNAWYEQNQRDTTPTIADGGGFLDAATDEEIVSAEYIKNRLIVYFENSTWELVYLNNPLDPFRWQKLSDNLGSQSTFSSISFDKNVLTMGTTGVHACNGSGVDRIDEKIPDTVFQIRQRLMGDQRVWGIRDFFTELVYWTYPSVVGHLSTNDTFPNQVLVYNYRTGSWAINTDSITAFGYFEQSISKTWADSETYWEINSEQWSSGENQQNFRQVIAGNQEGYTFVVDANSPRNAPVLQITNIFLVGSQVRLTIINHNLDPGEYISIENASGVTFPTPANEGIFQIYTVIDSNTIRIVATMTGTYLGGGTVTRVSNMNIVSKQWNPYVSNDRNLYLAKINFCVEKTTSGEVTVNYQPSYSRLPMVEEAADTGTLLGTNVLETFALSLLENTQDRVWHPVYFQSDGEAIQIVIYMKDDPDLALSQIRRQAVAWSDFQLEGMVLYTMATTDRLQ